MKSSSHHRERVITQIRIARTHAQEHLYTAQRRTKEHHDQQAENHSFCEDHCIWIYNPNIKPGLSNKLCPLWHDFAGLMREVTHVNFRVLSENEKHWK